MATLIPNVRWDWDNKDAGNLPDCGYYDKGDWCYFKVTAFQFNDGELVIIARGKAHHSDDLINRGHTEWGWWVHHYGTTMGRGTGSDSGSDGQSGRTQSLSASTGASTGASVGTSTAASSSGSDSSAARTSSTMSPSGTRSSSGSRTSQQCVAPEDNANGLPTACLDDLFGFDFDNDLGWEGLRAEFKSFLKSAAPNREDGNSFDGSDDDGFVRRRQSAIAKRCWPSFLCDAIDEYDVQHIQDIQQGFQALQEATTISGSINQDISWLLSDTESSISQANTITNPDAKEVELEAETKARSVAGSLTSSVFEAEGQLALPMGIKCGIQVAIWEKSAGIIDEPSIKGVAQVAASIGLDDSGGFSAGFSDIDGCTGIATHISWRNKLYIDVFGFDTIGLFDTDDQPLARGNQSDSQTTTGTATTGSETGMASGIATGGTATGTANGSASDTASDDASGTASGIASGLTSTGKGATGTGSSSPTGTNAARETQVVQLILRGPSDETDPIATDDPDDGDNGDDDGDNGDDNSDGGDDADDEDQEQQSVPAKSIPAKNTLARR
ncbi:Fc.00g083580.m01.CDS01 [Cosmosporella sp. VM-42]